MTEIFFPLNPRPREDPAAAGVVQENLEYVMQLFQKGIEDGDILVWDKLLQRYLAKAAGGAELGSSLPILDLYPGRPFILTDNPTNPSYLWHLRYNPDSPSSYKWECMGGSPGMSVTTALGQEATTSTTYTNLATIGPDFQIPAGIGGDFLIEAGASLAHDIAGNTSFMSYDLGATPAVDSDAVRGSTSDPVSAMKKRKKLAVASGALIRARYRSSTAANEARFQNDRWITVFPYRVG